MIRNLAITLSAILCLMQVAFAQTTTMVEWNFPNNPDDSVADVATTIPNNTAKKLSIFGDVASPSFGTLAGFSTYAAWSTNFHHGNGTKGWVIEFTTMGYANLDVSSKQMSGNNGARNFKIQYKIGAGGTYTDLPGATNIVLNNSISSPTGVVNAVPLPAACDNQPSVYLRWIMTSDISVVGGTIFQPAVSRIDEIVVKANANVVTPLPVGFLNFDVKAANNHVELKWATAAEPGNDFFTIERSSNMIDIHVLNTIPAKGNFNTGACYDVFDYKPAEGISYYRLKQTDVNGKSTYTAWKAVEIKTDKEQQLQVVVNNNGIDFTVWPLSTATAARVCIYTSAGVLLADYHLNLNTTNHINGYFLAQGMYFITVETGDMLLKQKFQY